MSELFEAHYPREEREDGFDNDTLVPSTSATDFEVGWIVVFGFESLIGQDDHPLFPSLDQRMKTGVMHVGSGDIEGHNASEVIVEDTELGTNDP